MGLYLVQKTVKAHGGFVEMESEKDKGTTFTLYFPVAKAKSGIVRESPPAPEPDLLKGTVLVVDDEEVVRELLKGLLSSEGFEVLQAEHGAEAVDIFKGRASSIDLVILDMIMPGMKGEEVLKKLRRMSKSLKVIISSGFMTEEQRDKLSEYGVDGFLDKPYGDTDAVRTVRSVMTRSKEA
jgi:CheY-like chemotaxis protein